MHSSSDYQNNNETVIPVWYQQLLQVLIVKISIFQLFIRLCHGKWGVAFGARNRYLDGRMQRSARGRQQCVREGSAGTVLGVGA